MANTILLLQGIPFTCPLKRDRTTERRVAQGAANLGNLENELVSRYRCRATDEYEHGRIHQGERRARQREHGVPFPS